MNMKGELIGQSVQQGITIYNNSGKTTHHGAELALSYQLIKPQDQLKVSGLRPFVALTYSDFKFTDYKVLNAANEVAAVYNGNQLTGVAPWVLNAGLDAGLTNGLSLFINYLYSDRLPLNDANTAYNASYQVLNTKVTYPVVLGKHLALNLYAGIDNVLNERYSSIVALNAVGYAGAQPAYFLPSPGRSGYGGLNVKWNF